jgi:hypothetical protein
LLFQDAYDQLLLVLLIISLWRREATVKMYLQRGWDLFGIWSVCSTDVSRKVNVNCCAWNVFLSVPDRLERSSGTWLVAVVYVTRNKSMYACNCSASYRGLFPAQRTGTSGYCKMMVTCVVHRTQIGSKYCDM